MRPSLQSVLNFHFKNHRHGFVMPHKEHVPKFHFHGMYVGAEPSKKLSLKDLYHETDLRFWAKTKYKVGLPLNSQDPLDRPYIKQWTAIFQQVNNEYKKGKLSTFPEGTWEMATQSQQPTQQPSQVQVSQPYQPTPTTVTLADTHQDQADLHQAQADDHKLQAAQYAESAVAAAQDGNTVKAAEHTDLSNQHNEQAETHQKQADIHSSIASSLKDAKSYAQNMANQQSGNFIGVKIFTNGLTTAIPFDSRDMLDTWYGTTSDEDLAEGQRTGAWKVQYVGAFDKTDPSWPDSVNEYGASVMQLPVTAHAPPPVSMPKAEETPPVKSSGGAAIGFMLALGGGLLLATGAAKGKR
jgi:hypothetical protein